MRLRNFQNPPLVNKREVGDTGGGIAILCHERVRCKYLDEYNVKGLRGNLGGGNDKLSKVCHRFCLHSPI